MPGLDDAVECRTRKDCAERQPAAERFCERDHVGHDTRMLESEELSGSAEPALNLIEDQHRPRAVRELPRGYEELIAEWNDSRFPEHGLENDRRGVVRDGRLKR